MKLTKAKAASLAVIFLLYYIYMNSMRKVMIPQSSIMVPVILMFVFFLQCIVVTLRLLYVAIWMWLNVFPGS